eukprot:Colp12_sorted_trinity150504_noHs@30629
MLKKQASIAKPIQTARSVVLCTALLLLLAPVLHTLAESISTDTIYALSVILFVGRLVLHDYTKAATVRNAASLSLNLALFGSVCLASRVPGIWSAFALVHFAVLLHALLPVYANTVRSTTKEWHTVPIALNTAAGVLIACLSLPTSILYAATALSITFLCPLWLGSIRKYKEELRGPWDEAVVETRG